MRSRAWIATIALAALAGSACGQDPDFVDHLPGSLPDLVDWERTGEILDLDDPLRTLEYELYVDPRRGGEWAVVHYRVRVEDPAEKARLGVDDDEKLQWSVDGRTLRRFACRPSSSGCAWQELPHGSPEYEQELGTVLFIYRVHRRLLRARARSLFPHRD